MVAMAVLKFLSDYHEEGMEVSQKIVALFVSAGPTIFKRNRSSCVLET